MCPSAYQCSDQCSDQWTDQCSDQCSDIGADQCANAFTHGSIDHSSHPSHDHLLDPLSPLRLEQFFAHISYTAAYYSVHHFTTASLSQTSAQLTHTSHAHALDQVR